MGFFKRILSIGKKKNKTKDKHIPLSEQFIRHPTIEEEHEAFVGKLLRSTSARVLETSESNYATLPPIPHPINKIVQTPASSTLSLETSSLFQRGTYNVTIHRRRTHSSTEFPNANRDLDNNQHGGLQPVEDSRMIGLRSDPSVASLLELYDEHGRLSNDAFANDESPPIQEGRAQVRRSGSTFRQLLGASSIKSENDNSEGDISWAERYLAESDATSVTSSSGLETPESGEISAFKGRATVPELSMISDADLSFTAFDNPAISSMEVEVNYSYDTSGGELELSSNSNCPYTRSDPATPQRASQIFDFLTKQKQSKPPVDLDRTLPELPSCFSSPSEEGINCHGRSLGNKDSLARNPKRFSAPNPLDSDIHRLSRPRSSLTETTPRADIRHSQAQHTIISDDHRERRYKIAMPFKAQTWAKQSSNVKDAKRNDVKILMTGPTKVILTAPTPGTTRVGPPRVLLGPRPPNRKSSAGSFKRRSALGDISSNSSTILGDPFQIIIPKQKPHRERRGSTSSTRSFSRQEYERNENYISQPRKHRPTSPAPNKENQLSLSVKNDLPSTPLRSNTSATSRSFFRNRVQPGKVRTPAVPDPNLSSELSPVGRQIMDDIRQQRTRAREVDRARLGSRF